MRKLRHLAVALVSAATVVLTSASVSHAAGPAVSGKIAFIRGGNLFVATAGTATQVTTDGGYSWPRWAPMAQQGEISFVHNGNLFIARYDGHTLLNQVQISTGLRVGGAAWSPDATQLLYLDGSFESGALHFVPLVDVLGVLQPAARPAKVVHTGAARPAGVAAPAAKEFKQSALWDSDSVAWSPDGLFIAFPGGDCTGLADDCLTSMELATGEQFELEGFSGGGDEREGFATVPAFTADSTRVLWTQQDSDPLINGGLTGPTQIWSSTRLGARPNVKVGGDGDSTPAPSPAGGGAMLVTGAKGHLAWIVLIGANGHRTPLYQGYEPDWQQS